MKHQYGLVVAGLLLYVAISFLFSCTKEGPQGPPGNDGTNGTDANSNCIQCHSWNDSLVTRIFQYNSSQHAAGNATWVSPQRECAPCHASQGFTECISTGQFMTSSPVYDAAPVNCRTCHKIHTTYSYLDWQLRTTVPFRARYDSTVTINLSAIDASSNLCGRCHQATAPNPALTNPTSTFDTVLITSNAWGPHHATQALLLAGKGAYEIGAAPFSQIVSHKDNASCSTCHSAYGQGNRVGGHTWKMADYNQYPSLQNTLACQQCHSGAVDFNINGKQTEIAGLFQQLKVQLASADILDTIPFSSSYMLLKGDISVINPKTFPQKTMAVYWNFQLVYADRSNGVHNYPYTRDILQSGIDYFSSLGYSSGD